MKKTKCARASVEIDAIVAVAIFVLFIAWAFSYYSNVTDGSYYSMPYSLEKTSNKIIGFLKPEGYNVTLKYHPAIAKNGSLLYFDYEWLFGRETTMIYKNGVRLPCQISGSRVYFQADLESGDNYFYMVYTNESATGCSSSLTLSDEKRADVFSMEWYAFFSEVRISSMKSMGYGKFRGLLGIDNEFRVSLEVNGVTETFGKPLPHLNVYSKSTAGIVGMGKSIKATVWVW